ncbi:hypothetical protein ACWGJB_27545 [Streptomyces sp. NPDC054813]
MLQFLLGLSDRQAAEAVRCRIDFEYAMAWRAAAGNRRATATGSWSTRCPTWWAGGITWRTMPADFLAWDRVYAFFRRWRDKGLTAEFHDRLPDQVREAAVRAPLRSGGEAGLSGPRAIVRVMTSVKDPEDFVGVTDTIDALLRQCVDHINRNRDMCTLKAEWFAYIGELTLEGEVTWFGMGRGGWYHDGLPTGLRKAPVYAGFYWCREDDKPPTSKSYPRLSDATWGCRIRGPDQTPPELRASR